MALAGRVAARPEPPRETLREKYERVFGKPPHHRMKLDTIRERLREHGHAE